jgi:mono/diheme cytochrome c family protein
MLANIAIFLVLVAITVGLGFLAYRAIRARKVWVKLVGGVPASLLTLVFAAVSVTAAIGLSKGYGTVNPPIPANLKIDGTPAQLARGQYIVNVNCAGCHAANPEDRKSPLTGGADFAGEIPIPIGSLIVSNIASDGQIKDYTDAQLFRVIRHGVRRDGVPLMFMPFLSIREFSDEDVKSVIAYLRAQPPARSNKEGGDQPNFIAVLLLGAGMFPGFTPAQETVASIPQGVTPAYGKYAATLGDCRGCHGPDMTGTPDSNLGPGAPNPRPFVATITVDQFRQTLKTGKRPNGTELKMPWQNAAQMTDDDLAAMYAYLKAQP